MKNKFEYYINNKRYTTNTRSLIPFNQLHNDKGIAYIAYYNNNLETEAYYINGKKHREDGPAIIFYRLDKTRHVYYYLNNIPFSIKQFNFIKKCNKQNEQLNNLDRDFLLLFKMET